MLVPDATLLERLRSGEDSLIEFKPQGAGPADFKRTLVAFANSVPDSGVATLFIGVGDRGQILGVENPDKLQKDIRKICEDDCFPPISHTTRLITQESKIILVVMVGFSAERPHFSGAAYIRKGSESIKASEEVYEDLISSRNDKARRLLAYKDKPITIANELSITAIAFQNKLGLGRPLERRRGLGGITPYGRPEHYEAIVEGCDAFCLFLRVVETNQTVSVRLSVLEIDHDMERDRLMIHVRE
jgi:hypothetical protein